MKPQKSFFPPFAGGLLLPRCFHVHQTFASAMKIAGILFELKKCFS